MAQVVVYAQVDRNVFAAYGGALQPSVLLKLIGLRLTGFMTDRFENDGANTEFNLPAWEPLKPSTISMRRSGSSRPLQDSGRLRMSYLAQPETDNSTYVEVGSNMEYASYHEDSTGPYVITAKTKRGLAAQLASGGWVRFGKKVNHPGLPARPVLPSVQNAEQMMLEEYEEVLRTAIEGEDDTQ